MKQLCTQYLIKERTKPLPELLFFMMHTARQGGQFLCSLPLMQRLHNDAEKKKAQLLLSM